MAGGYRWAMFANNLKVMEDMFHLIAKRRLDPSFDLIGAAENMGFSVDLAGKRIHKQEFDRYGEVENEIGLDINPALLGLEP